MSETKIILKYLLLLFLILTMRANSQGLKWETPDSGNVPIFQNKEQIAEWSYRNGGMVGDTSTIVINGINFYIVAAVGCSGVQCWTIFIFKEKDGLWQLYRSAKLSYIEDVKILVDKEKRVIIFKSRTVTDSKPEYGPIYELPFEKLFDK